LAQHRGIQQEGVAAVTLFDVFVVLFWACATGSLVALLVASLMPRCHRQGLVSAALLLLVAGALGLASIGILLWVAAGCCAYAASRMRTVQIRGDL
jgi:hypothetical protein